MELVWIIWLLCALIGYIIGNNKGRGGLGFTLGLLLGLIGIIIILVLDDKK